MTKRQVALIIETSSVYGRDLLSGVVSFMRMHDEWSVFLEQRDLIKKPPAWLSSWEGDGIISRATTPGLIEAVERTGVPLVELTDRRGDSGLPLVRSDDKAIGRMAALHLKERGFERFGFCGFSREAWSERRQQGFVDCVEQDGAPCSVFNSPWHGPSVRAWEDEQERIAAWLQDLTPPLGILACNDLRGQHVLNACSEAGLSVPEDVAVLGVDNDELLCRLCTPPLTSVIPNARGVGYQAAELLARLMDGQPLGERAQAMAPLGVATRQSTDVVAIPDRRIAAALRFIRENACRGISVDDVIQNTPVSRSTLERALRRLLGRTPQQEIRQVQVKRARELLMATDLSVEQIAPLCGFDHPEYMHVVFKRVIGMTPGAFRSQTPGASGPEPA